MDYTHARDARLHRPYALMNPVPSAACIVTLVCNALLLLQHNVDEPSLTATSDLEIGAYSVYRHPCVKRLIVGMAEPSSHQVLLHRIGSFLMIASRLSQATDDW